MQRTKEDIYALIKKGERLHAECKEAFGGMPDTLWESYSSFANTDGGVIVLGVKERADHSLVVQGVKDADALIKCFWEIFNIFALVKIGERSGAGLSDLYGQWEKYGFPPPVIEEKYDPDRTVVRVTVESNSVKSRQEVDKKQTIISVEGSVKSGQTSDPSMTQGCPKYDPRVAQDMPASVKQVYKAMCADPSMTLRGLSSKLGFSKTTVTKAVGVLIKENFIRRVGPRFGGHWEIVKPQPETGGNGS